MLTPKDIHEKDFSKSFKGYDMEEVDLFLDQIIEDYDKLIRENRELSARIEALNTQIETYRGMENSLMHTMVSAHKAADDISDKAKSDADSVLEKAKEERERMLAEANERAQQIVNNKQNDVLETEARIRELNDILEEFKSGIVGYSDELLKLVETFAAPDSASEIVDYQPTEYEFTTIHTEEEAELEAPSYKPDDRPEEDFHTREFSSSEVMEESSDGESDYSTDSSFYPMEDNQFENVDSSDMEQVDINTLMGQFYEESNLGESSLGDDEDKVDDEEDVSTFYSIQEDAYSEKAYAPSSYKAEEQYYGPIDLDDDEVL